MFLNSCERSTHSGHPEMVSKHDSSKRNKLKKHTAKELIPVFGYRFRITGDFNGDGKKEKLTEHFISNIDHKESSKFYENGDYDTLVSINHKKQTVSFLSCDDKNVPDLIADPKGHSLGLAYLKNEGDLDGDGADEISYVVDWADWSNVNFCEIMTCKNHKWRTLYSFQIRDWQLPDLPQTYNQYGIAGLDNKIINTVDTAANRGIGKSLHDFKGLIKKLANHKIRIIYLSEDAVVDTKVVDIKRHR